MGSLGFLKAWAEEIRAERGCTDFLRDFEVRLIAGSELEPTALCVCHFISLGLSLTSIYKHTFSYNLAN